MQWGSEDPEPTVFFLGSPPIPPATLASAIEPVKEARSAGGSAVVSIRKSDTHGLGMFVDKDVPSGEVLIDIKLQC